MTVSRGRLVTLAFIAEAILAGANGVAIRFSNRELAPIWGAGLRFALAAVLMVSIMLALRLTLPHGRALPRGRALLGAITLSAWLDQEPVTGGLLLGGLLVLGGVYLGALRTKPASPFPAEEPQKSFNQG